MSLSDISNKFTEKTLDEIVQKAGGTKHTSYKFGPGFKKGDSYLSKVFRLTVDGVNEKNGSVLEVHLICKGMPDNVARRKVFHSADFFRNEINFYTKVVPAWEAFQARRKPTNPFTEYPRCFASHCDGENDFIALENVSFRGYGAPNRQDYISLEDALLTMRTLGRFHGISLAFRALEPENFEAAAKGLEETYYNEGKRSWYIGFLGLACNVAKDAIEKTYPGTKYETIAAKFLQPTPLYDDLIKLVSADSPLAAIGHGDCWTPNFLTRYSKDNSPEAIIIIDFQLARRASIALDISFFIYSCTSEELRARHYEQLLKEYHQSASALIADLGADVSTVLSWQAFQNELQHFARFGCGMGIESLPMSLIEDDEVADLDDMKEDAVLTDVWNIKPFKEQRKRERIAQIFKHAIDQSYIKN
ncbi:uncharacterized protein LOC118733084 isoform X2 [Rhagoletis pomonella]|nr:uncharacterized protein LOC118733084 isoform X2 [Rhagoletis pomonella]XP_036318179.1 uncharacterized protein LOC118733084 isoform X2 [Rhagoletis pomonella]XP_036318180.1 uncharacterized protein LOC118733084 isoform X2 [Rhagoletis pomonella]